MFDASAIHDAVAATMKDAAIDPTHKNAFVIVATSDGRVKGALTTKLGNHWAVTQYFSVQHDKPIEAGGVLKASWIVLLCLAPLMGG